MGSRSGYLRSVGLPLQLHYSLNPLPCHTPLSNTGPKRDKGWESNKETWLVSFLKIAWRSKGEAARHSVPYQRHKLIHSSRIPSPWKPFLY
ncbi:Choline transport protein [Fusarium oxysporum f. sp. albedinis]|nr:Choline transport protein [Fusarium oxysporum f. sp. albedinis]